MCALCWPRRRRPRTQLKTAPEYVDQLKPFVYRRVLTEFPGETRLRLGSRGSRRVRCHWSSHRAVCIVLRAIGFLFELSVVELCIFSRTECSVLRLVVSRSVQRRQCRLFLRERRGKLGTTGGQPGRGGTERPGRGSSLGRPASGRPVRQPSKFTYNHHQ